MSVAQFGLEEGVIQSYNKQNSMRKINWKRQLLYHGKWQLSSLFAIPLMYLLADYFGMNYWSSIISFNFIGAILFYPIDNYIFNRKKQKSIIDIMYAPPVLDDENKNKLLKDHAEDLKNEALREIENPNWDEAKPFCDWKAKVPTEFQANWPSLSEEIRLTIYYFTKNQALSEEE